MLYIKHVWADFAHNWIKCMTQVESQCESLQSPAAREQKTKTKQNMPITFKGQITDEEEIP